MPQNTFDLSFFKRIKGNIQSLSLESVFLISLIFPFAVFLFLFSLYRNYVYTKDISSVKGVFKKSPDDLSVCEVDILMKNRLTDKGISALIFQLIVKGYLTVLDKEEGLFLEKVKEPDDDLSRPEKILLKILFKRKEFKGGLKEIKKKKAKKLFSRLVDKLYQSFNKKIDRKEFFMGNPEKVKADVLKQAVVIFFLAALLGGFTLLFFPSAPWLGLAPLSMLIAAIIIVRMRSSFTIRSPGGQDELDKWLKFRNYLSGSWTVEKADKRVFEKYLPWAHLFGVLNQWVGKFSKYPMARPDWFVSSFFDQSVEDWANKAGRLADRLAKEISDLKSPAS